MTKANGKPRTNGKAPAESAAWGDIPTKPHDRQKAVCAAYLWLIHDEVKSAAEGAGVGERTMQRWVRAPWWPEICAEAERNWLRHLTITARRELTRALIGNGELALKILERRDPNLRPQPQQHEVGVVAVLASLSTTEVQRLNKLEGAELLNEMRALGAGGDG